jgi:hypothetical protein
LEIVSTSEAYISQGDMTATCEVIQECSKAQQNPVVCLVAQITPGLGKSLLGGRTRRKGECSGAQDSTKT